MENRQNAKNAEKWKNDKNAKNGFLGFRWWRAKIANSRFLGKSVFWVFQEKGRFFEKGVFGGFGRGVKNRGILGGGQK